jgi:hypothetical protein
MNRLRKKYNAAVHTDTTTQIEEALINSKVEFKHFTVRSELFFSDESKEHLKCLSYNRRYTGIKGKELVVTKMLLEFVAQTPLEYLDKTSKLHYYLSDVNSLLDKRHNRLKIKSEVHIAISPNSSQEFLIDINNIIKELEIEFGYTKSKIANKNIRKAKSELNVSHEFKELERSNPNDSSRALAASRSSGNTLFDYIQMTTEYNTFPPSTKLRNTTVEPSSTELVNKKC